MVKSNDKKMSSSGSLIREAEEFSNEDSGGDLNPVQLIKKHIISADEAFIAKDMLTIQKLENQKRINDLKKEISGAPQMVPMAQSQAPQTLLGTPSNNTPPIVSILNALPETDRKEFLDKNKDAIFQQSVTTPSNAPLMAQLLARQQQGQQQAGTDINGFANLLLAVNAMTESRAQSERELMLNMMNMMAAKNSQPAPSGNEGALAKLLESLNRKIDESNTTIKGEIESIKTTYQQQLIEAQKEAMNTQVELVKTQYASQIEQLQKSIEARGSQESFAQNIQNMISNLQAAGVNLTNETAEQERIRRDYSLKERELELRAEADARKNAVELENARARQQMWSGVGSIVASGMEAMRVQKAIESKGSPAARRITGRA